MSAVLSHCVHMSVYVLFCCRVNYGKIIPTNKIGRNEFSAIKHGFIADCFSINRTVRTLTAISMLMY